MRVRISVNIRIRVRAMVEWGYVGLRGVEVGWGDGGVGLRGVEWGGVGWR